MEWKDVGDAIKKVAPMLGTVLGGPAGGAVGGAVSMLVSALGVDDDEHTPEAVLRAMSADPEWHVKLREAEMRNRVELEKLALQADQLVLADRQSARDREIRIVEATGKRDMNLYVLAWTVILGFFTLCGVLMRWPLPEGSNQVVFMLFGALSTGFGTVLSYFFGSSKSSNDKTRMLSSSNNR